MDDTQETAAPAEVSLQLGRYRHYKGQYYHVLATARHSETREWVVVYRCLYGDYSFWVRPLAMFMEKVTLDSGQAVQRFSFVGEMARDI